jgi:hypothetical protein
MFGQPFHKKGKPLPAVQKPKLRIGQGAVKGQGGLPGNKGFGFPLDFFRNPDGPVLPGSNSPKGTDLFIIFRNDPVPSLSGTGPCHVQFQCGTGRGIFNNTYHGKDVIKTEKIQPVVGTGTLKEDGPLG